MPVDLVEAPLLGRQGAPGPLAVGLDQLLAGQHPGQVRGHPAVRRQVVVVGLHPEGEVAPEVHQRVAEGGHLPVEDGDHLRRVVGVEDQVVELEVVVDHAVGDVLGLVLVEPGHGALEVGGVVGAGVAVAARPALDLAADVAEALAELAQAGGLVVDAVQLGEHVDHRQAHAAGLLGGERVGGQVAARDQALDPLHGVEVAPHHLGVVAEGDHRGRRRGTPAGAGPGCGTPGPCRGPPAPWCRAAPSAG